MRGCAAALAAPFAVERRVGMASCRSRVVFWGKALGVCLFSAGFRSSVGKLVWTEHGPSICGRKRS